MIGQRQKSTDFVENIQQPLFSGKYDEESFEDSFKQIKVRYKCCLNFLRKSKKSIQVDNLKKVINGTNILNNINFSVSEQEIFWYNNFFH